MLLRYFQKYRPSTLILVLLTARALWIKPFSHLTPYAFSFDQLEMPLYQWFKGFFTAGSVMGTVVSFACILIIAFYLLRLNNLYIFIPERTYLPALFFILIASSYVPLNKLNPVFPAAVLVVYALNKIIKSYKTDNLSYRIFDASLVISSASLIYLPSILFLVVVWISLIAFRPFFLREWLYSILGPTIIALILVSGAYLLSWDLGIYKTAVQGYLTMHQSDSLSVYKIILYCYIIFLILISSVNMIRVYPSIKIYSRKTFTLFLYFFLIGCLMFFIPAVQIEMLVFLTIPVSYILAYYFLSFRKRWMGELLFFILTALIVICQFR